MMKNQRGSAAVQIVWAVAGIVVIAAGILLVRYTRPGAPEKFNTPYQAVVLMNGSAYFGKLEGYGTPKPMLTEVYYVVTQTNPETKQNNSVLVKRGAHEPDRTYLNPGQILFVEPVGEKSQVAQLIAKQR
jgi:bacteriorhodopsin